VFLVSAYTRATETTGPCGQRHLLPSWFVSSSSSQTRGKRSFLEKIRDQLKEVSRLATRLTTRDWRGRADEKRPSGTTDPDGTQGWTALVVTLGTSFTCGAGPL